MNKTRTDQHLFGMARDTGGTPGCQAIHFCRFAPTVFFLLPKPARWRFYSLRMTAGKDWHAVMRWMFVAAVLDAGSPPVPAQTITTAAPGQTVSGQTGTDRMQVLAPHVPTHTGGRAVTQALAATRNAPRPDDTRIGDTPQWPGVYCKGAFAGITAVLKFDDAQNDCRILIDDPAPMA